MKSGTLIKNIEAGLNKAVGVDIPQESVALIRKYAIKIHDGECTKEEAIKRIKDGLQPVEQSDR